MSRLPVDLKRFQETLTDAARIGSREVKRGVDRAKRQLERMQHIQKRKDLFAELGRAVYDAHCDGLPQPVAAFLAESQLQEIIDEIRSVDKELEERQKAT